VVEASGYAVQRFEDTLGELRRGLDVGTEISLSRRRGKAPLDIQPLLNFGSEEVLEIPVERVLGAVAVVLRLPGVRAGEAWSDWAERVRPAVQSKVQEAANKSA
jgi:hypothetical protein